jgi:hypothetical protein
MGKAEGELKVLKGQIYSETGEARPQCWVFIQDEKPLETMFSDNTP